MNDDLKSSGPTGETAGPQAVSGGGEGPGHGSRTPVLFVGHGSPMNAVEDNEYARAWRRLGESLPRPRAILSISAHWLTRGTRVDVSQRPATIHDFWGFPERLYRKEYGCPGAPELAARVQAMIHEAMVEPDSEWGLDHGTWMPLVRIYPSADIPTFQLSIDLTQPAGFHYRLGAELASLRDEGVLIMGSGNIVHNLGRVDFDPGAPPYDWAVEFDELAGRLIEAGDHEALMAYEKLGSAARLAVPTPDHYWPLMYILGLQGRSDRVSFPVTGIAHGSVSMRAVLVGEY